MGQQAYTNPRFALKHSGAVIYVALCVLAMLGAWYMAEITCSWAWISQAGNVVILFGFLLAFRRLFRLGPQRATDRDEPVVREVSGKFAKFNVNYMWQDIERTTDNYASAAGIALTCVGVLIAVVGDLFLKRILPFAGSCGP